jgi:exodeoxyribonuclease VII large subunit
VASRPPQPDDGAGHVFTVSEVNEVVRRLLDECFGEVAVQGEVSNAKCMPSGHWYFTLKDENAQLAAVLFRSDAAGLRFRLENGLGVRAFGRLTLYGAQGKFQIVVRAVVPVGQGALELAFQQLKRRLQAEGLFDPRRKRPLPPFPRRVALVTSESGAAVRDMLTTLAARWPLATVVLAPVSVQGDAAPPEIVRALQLVNRRRAADVVIVGRGGGSLEDLWAFNDERVARAIAASEIPVVSAVGHESDYTIADFVADVRAATPTAAAALVVPHQDEVRLGLQHAERRLGRALRRSIEVPRVRLEAMMRSYGLRRLQSLVPEAHQGVDARLERLAQAMRRAVQDQRGRLDAVLGRVQALSPRDVLNRGYVYCIDAQTGAVVARANQTAPGRELHLQFADGARAARVLEAAPEPRVAARRTPRRRSEEDP